MTSLNILFLGENWYGSCARACCYALRRLGCTVFDIDQQVVFGRWYSRRLRGSRLFLLGTLITEYNQRILALANRCSPDLVVVFKGTYVLAATVRHLRSLRLPVYNYFPDIRIPKNMRSALREYSTIFDTKANRRADDASGWRRRVHLEHGYDSDIYQKVSLNDAERTVFGCDISFIGTFDARKEMLLSAIARDIPAATMQIWGNGWGESSTDPNLSKSIQGMAAEGSAFAKAVSGSAINVGLLTGVSGCIDETTTRSYEIPACGGFMLHERTRGIQEVYTEGEEFAGFSGPRELVSKVRHYLPRVEERNAIAAAGQRRTVPAYSYDVRMSTLLEWHFRHGKEVVE